MSAAADRSSPAPGRSSGGTLDEAHPWPRVYYPNDHRLVLTEALRAPSAHNAQPWRLAVRPGGRYELRYNHLDYLPYDPDDRDAYLAIGAFLETLELAAVRRGLRAVVYAAIRAARKRPAGRVDRAQGEPRR